MNLLEETFRLEAAIRVLHRTVFGREEESHLIDLLRKDGLITASVAAEEQGHLAGHVLFSDLRVETQHGTVFASALGPLAVLPEWQGCGVGSALVREGMDLCRQRGKTAVIVLGEPKFYTRFGFSAALARKLMSPYSDAGQAWMACELQPDALRDAYGFVKYPEAWRIFDPKE